MSPINVHNGSTPLARPRLPITYPLEIEGSAVEREIPFVVGVLGDYSARTTVPLKPLKERRFIQVDRGNFDDVMSRMTPGLEFRVANTLTADGSKLAVNLRFRAMSDFDPERVVRQVEPLRILAENRDRRLDKPLATQLAAILHHADFQKLEGTWRGLHHLVMNSETGPTLKIKVLNISKRELFRDMDRAVEFDQSQIFKKLYEQELGTLGGEPYGIVIGDYEFNDHLEDIDLLRKLSNVASAAMCPFISAAGPGLFGMDSWQELNRPRSLVRIFAALEYAPWRAFRESEDARFVSLVMPRVLARLPYLSDSDAGLMADFAFQEFEASKPIAYDDFTWMNGAYGLGTFLTDSFAKYGSCTANWGTGGEAKVEGLPTFRFATGDGNVDPNRSTEVAIANSRSAELSRLGFLPLCHDEDARCAVFFGGQTVHHPTKDVRAESTEFPAALTQLPCLLVTVRFCHYIQVMARDGIDGCTETGDLEMELNRWITKFVNSNPKAGPETRSKYPLRQAEVILEKNEFQPGWLRANVVLRLWHTDDTGALAAPLRQVVGNILSASGI